MSGSLRHDDAGGVHAPLALQALEAEGGLEDLLRLGVGRRWSCAELAGLVVALVVLGSKMPASGMSLPMTAGGIALVSCSPIANG